MIVSLRNNGVMRRCLTQGKLVVMVIAAGLGILTWWLLDDGARGVAIGTILGMLISAVGVMVPFVHSQVTEPSSLGGSVGKVPASERVAQVSLRYEWEQRNRLLADSGAPKPG